MSFLCTCQLLFLLLIDRFNVTQAGETTTAHSISKLLKVAKIRYWYIIMQPMSKGFFGILVNTILTGCWSLKVTKARDIIYSSLSLNDILNKFNFLKPPYKNHVSKMLLNSLLAHSNSNFCKKKTITLTCLF